MFKNPKVLSKFRLVQNGLLRKRPIMPGDFRRLRLFISVRRKRKEQFNGRFKSKCNAMTQTSYVHVQNLYLQ